MNLESWITLSVLVSVVGALAFTALAPDAVLFTSVVILFVGGVLTADEAFAGFSNSGVLTVGALFVVAGGLRETGAVSRLARQVLGRPKTVRAALARLVIPVTAMSTFLNNTPIVAALMPATVEWGRQNRFAPSKLLIPLSYAAILGGTCSLIGTSTNLVVQGLLTAASDGRPDLRPLGMFEISWIGVPVALFGVVYMILLAPKLLIDRSPALSVDVDMKEYTVELVVRPTSPLVGQTIEEAGLRHLPGAFLVELDRGERVIAAVGPEERLEAGDRLVFAGILESVIDLQRLPGLTPADDQVHKLGGAREARCLVEAVVSRSNPFVGQSIRSARFRSVYNAVVIAVARHGVKLNMKIGDIELHEGDTLLMETHNDWVLSHRNRRDFYLVSEVADSTPLRHERAWRAGLILAVMVTVATVGLMDMLQASFLAAGAMIVTRCCTVSEARRSADWPVLIAIASAFGLGEAIGKSGLDRVLADGIITNFASTPAVALAAVYLAGAMLTNVMTNNAAAALIFPFAISVADQLKVSPMPFVLATTMAASACFATPIGYQTNLMVYGPGGYRFSDFVRIGLPLNIVIWGMCVWLIPVFWPF